MDGPLTRAPLPLPSFDRGEGGNKTRIANCFFFLFSKEFHPIQFHPSHRANYPEFIPDFHPLFLSPRIIGAIRQWIRAISAIVVYFRSMNFSLIDRRRRRWFLRTK